jgi:hypothetical protein
VAAFGRAAAGRFHWGEAVAARHQQRTLPCR